MIKAKFFISILVLIFILFINNSCSKPKKEFEDLSVGVIQTEQDTQILHFSKKWLENYQNITTIGGGLLYGSSQLCDKSSHAFDIGLKVANIYSVPSNLASSLQKILNLNDYLSVVSVENHSPSDNANIQVGDRIISIDGIELFGEYALNQYETIINRDLQKDYQIVINRETKTKTINLKSKTKCAFNINVDFDNNQFNAWVDDYNNLTFSLRLADWLKNDELSAAVIMSHEMAHLILKHVDIKKNNKKIAGIIGLAFDIGAFTSGINTSGRIKSIAEDFGAQRYSQVMEKEADYYGAYILAINNYEYDKTPDFWRKFSIEVPDSIYTKRNSSHPSTAERFVLLEATINEIEKKKKNNQPLMPN